MGSNYLKRAAAAVGNPPQSQPLDSRQVANNAGGFVYAVDDWKRLDRFLILGSEKGTYYVGEHELSVKNIECIKRCVASDGIRTVNRIVEISDSGRAPKNDPALLALAYAASKGDEKTRHAALAALPQVARIGTHLFHFIAFAKQFRGMGRGLRNAIVEWYASKNPNQFAQQVTKYQQRDGWSHRDLLRLTHPKFSGTHQLIARWVVKGELEAENGDAIPQALIGHVAIQKATTPKEAAELIREFGVVRESVPTQLLNSPEVWEALLEKMPLTAMIRNLGNMSKVGLLAVGTEAAISVRARLEDEEALRKARVHPIQILLASKTYELGHGLKGSGSWTAVPKVIDALDTAYYLTFKNVVPTGKRFYLALDISGSMWGNMIAGTALDAAVGSAAMAMVTVKTEEEYYVSGFTSAGGGYGGQWGGNSALTPMTLSPKQRLDDVLKVAEKLRERMGGTDCALPMIDALQKGIKADVFVVYTDSETWAGRVHPMIALQNYRNKTGINAKLVVVGMTATEFTIADPTDAGTLDCVGFDANTPAILADFARE